MLTGQKIQTATHENVAVRYLCADHHPGHDSISKLRRENKELYNFTDPESRIMKDKGTFNQ